MNDQLSLQYANQSMQYTTQFIASMSDEEVVIDCGSVVIPLGDQDQRQLPIHTRMAMPWSAVERLHRLLGNLIQSRNNVADVTSNGGDLEASLPPFSIDSATPQKRAS